MKRKRIYRAAIAFFLSVIFLLLFYIYHQNLSGKAKNKYQVAVETLSFSESARALHNPNRGFYYMHGFLIEDEQMDFQREFATRYCYDTDTALTLIEINLIRYRDREISRQGLENIEKLFAQFQQVDKKMVLRFLYDWDGRNMETEPDSRAVIETHMKQLEPILRSYQQEIFVIQGLFVGDMGEMHDSKFLSDEDIRTLAGQLAAVTDERTFLAVRTPLYWRKITQIAAPEQVMREDGSLASRLGLYNDGMLGSITDYGTYGTGSLSENGLFVQWNRQDEIAFQDTLCRLVPIGGEVIVDNPYNDLETAIADLSAMHVTYLNRAYDGRVMEKWQNTPVSEPGCFDGMDGLSYVERHLGYRLVIDEAQLLYRPQEHALAVDITIRNIGFAPVYKDAGVRILLCREDGSELYAQTIPQDIRELTGGRQSGDSLVLHADIPLTGLTDGTWQIFFETSDTETGQRILYGNEQEPQPYGYPVGSVRITTLF